MFSITLTMQTRRRGRPSIAHSSARRRPRFITMEHPALLTLAQCGRPSPLSLASALIIHCVRYAPSQGGSIFSVQSSTSGLAGWVSAAKVRLHDSDARSIDDVTHLCCSTVHANWTTTRDVGHRLIHASWAVVCAAGIVGI